MHGYRIVFNGSMVVAILASALMVLAPGCDTGLPEVGREHGHCYPSGTCNSGLICVSNFCVDPVTGCWADCGGLECGVDPVCGKSCGTCGEGYLCHDGECVWEPDDYNVSCSDGMCLIPAGSFWMGCDDSVDDHCMPQTLPYHEVTLSGYYMDRTEVTLDQYAECVTEGFCTEPRTFDCNWGQSGKGNHPVNCVDWTQAGEYCAWAGKRLPTEAEWEKAARGTDGRKYPWGNETATCEYAVTTDCGGDCCGTDRTWDVCSKSPAGDSPYGLCDMAGNVFEWVSDWYYRDYYYDSPASKPTGPVSGEYHVMRGGSWWTDSQNALAYTRGNMFESDINDINVGFRCARDAQ